MASMTDNDPTRPAQPDEEPTPWPRDEPDDSLLVEEPGYLTESGQAVGEDGSVVPIIGGLPAVEGSSWDIGAPEEDRGVGLADDLGGAPDHGR
jgi:hypothetical protein